MGDFLTAMAESSRRRAAATLSREPFAVLRRRALDTPPAPPLRLSGFDLIAEVKIASPSAGRLLGPGESGAGAVADRARAYAEAGAAAVSVLTEPDRFGGEMAHLVEASAAAPVPCMRKDFLVEPAQVFEARAAGAGGVLLIARMLGDRPLDEMMAAAAESGMFVLLEVFDEGDAARARAAQQAARAGPPVLIGVNTRDLRTLAVDPGRLARLVPALAGAGVRLVAESGIEEPTHAAAAASLGYDLILVGAALSRAHDAPGLAGRMLHAGRAARVTAEAKGARP